MTCLRLHGAIVCVNPWGRLHVGNRYIWFDYHEYLGPSFYSDSAMTKLYEPTGEDDPMWPEFEKWLAKYNRKKGTQ